MRIATISDTHKTVPETESESLFPGHMKKLPPAQAEELYHRIRFGIDDAYSTVLEDLGRSKPYAIIHLGDVVGGYREQGCFHPSAQALSRRMKDDLESISPAYFALGNHDVGYPGSEEGEGITQKSLEVCENIYGNLWWKIYAGGVLVVGLCSSLAEYSGSERFVWLRVSEQRDFFFASLDSWDGPWALAVHSPFFPTAYAREIEPYLGKLEAMITGDLHSTAAPKILRTLVSPTFVPGNSLKVWAACMKKVIPCPSVAPLWSAGSKYLNLSMEAQKIKVEEVRLPAKRLITQNPLRCAWWMAEAYM